MSQNKQKILPITHGNCPSTANPVITTPTNTAAVPLIFRINDQMGYGPELVRQAFFESGMIEFDPAKHNEMQWNLWWRTGRFRQCDVINLQTWQRVNHYPVSFSSVSGCGGGGCGGGGDITLKDGLLRNLRRMKRLFHGIYHFFPETYQLMKECREFEARFSQARHREEARLIAERRDLLTSRICEDTQELLRFSHLLVAPPANPHGNNNSSSADGAAAGGGGGGGGGNTGRASRYGNNAWIFKPSDSSRGRGIYIFDNWKDAHLSANSIVQRYITNPYLIYGYKFDLRIYVVIASFLPLIIYVYRDGLVRFSTEKFDMANLANVFAHLTNTSINVNGPSYTSRKAGIGVGCKWSFKQFRQHLRQRGVRDHILWRKILGIIMLTILSQSESAGKCPNCFELFGFDIIIDENLKPWLLEVNFTPAMGNDCPLDEQVKKSLVRDILCMLGFQSSDGLHNSWKRQSLKAISKNNYSSRNNRMPHSKLKYNSLPNYHCPRKTSTKRQLISVNQMPPYSEGEPEENPANLCTFDAHTRRLSSRLHKDTVNSKRRHRTQCCNTIARIDWRKLEIDVHKSAANSARKAFDTYFHEFLQREHKYNDPIRSAQMEFLANVRAESRVLSSSRLSVSSKFNRSTPPEKQVNSKNDDKDEVERATLTKSDENDLEKENTLDVREHSADDNQTFRTGTARNLQEKPAQNKLRILDVLRNQYHASLPPKNATARCSNQPSMFYGVGAKKFFSPTSNTLSDCIPVKFGQLCLAYPFNHNLRHNYAYKPSTKDIVGEIAKFLAHSSQEDAEGKLIDCTEILDIPDVWPLLAD